VNGPPSVSSWCTDHPLCYKKGPLWTRRLQQLTTAFYSTTTWPPPLSQTSSSTLMTSLHFPPTPEESHSTMLTPLGPPNPSRSPRRLLCYHSSLAQVSTRPSPNLFHRLPQPAPNLESQVTPTFVSDSLDARRRSSCPSYAPPVVKKSTTMLPGVSPATKTGAAAEQPPQLLLRNPFQPTPMLQDATHLPRKTLNCFLLLPTSSQTWPLTNAVASSQPVSRTCFKNSERMFEDLAPSDPNNVHPCHCHQRPVPHLDLIVPATTPVVIPDNVHTPPWNWMS